MSSSINGQEFEAAGSSVLSLSSSIAFPSSVSSAWTPSDSDLVEIYNQMTTNESESMDFDESNATQGRPSFWIVDSGTRGKHYQCECGRITKNKGDMRRHRQSLKHSGRSHNCPCGGTYTRKDSLKRHAQACSYAAGNLNNA
ncbi:hypothetical protein M378DRAFT_853973 [Amanita muscaria Koide BX008]|uniref:C2H2-type domain-containing protein n=1 Tax=Amanita muscaria (strain Koide BX008) TaxID=946122 RepID=A0A0C2WYS4_AMAMK|nr:hypothetical protein M378DRAFT_853973 [Amanita muscaria Koide BX008]